MKYKNSKKCLTLKVFEFRWIMISLLWVFSDLITNQGFVILIKFLLLCAIMRIQKNGVFVLATLFLVLYSGIIFAGTHWAMNSFRTATQPLLVLLCINYLRPCTYQQLIYIVRCFTVLYFISLVLGFVINEPIYGAGLNQFGGSRGLVYSGNQIAIVISILAWANVLIARRVNNHFFFYLSIVSLLLVATKFCFLMAFLVIFVASIHNSVYLLRYFALLMLSTVGFFTHLFLNKIADFFSVFSLYFYLLDTKGVFVAITNDRINRIHQFSWEFIKVRYADNFEIDVLNIAYSFSFIGSAIYLVLVYRLLTAGHAIKLLAFRNLLILSLFLTTGHLTQSVISIPLLSVFILLFGYYRQSREHAKFA